jgi:CcmD family protein
VSNLSYLFAAFLITWVVIAAYLWMLGRQVQNLKDEVESLTENVDLAPDTFEAVVRPEAEGHRVGSGQQ